MADWPANGTNVDTWDAALKTYLDDEKASGQADTAAGWTGADPILAAGTIGIETDTGKFKIGDGTTEWTNLLYSGFPQAYGHMYAKNATIVVNVGAADTAYEIGSGLSSGLVSGTTFGGNHYLQVAKTGIYKIDYSVSMDAVVAASQLEAGAMVNGSEVADDGGGHGTVDTGDASDCMSGTVIVSLAADDQVSLYVRNHSGVNNITVEHLNCSVVRIG
ncbi:hypothetical protein M0R72_09085 [Candidatus Pacearchaeota archaeon]|jgi:hypothetical protein|nr:hypothetical protein [Candidatus Pacearchaeota archaeon]